MTKIASALLACLIAASITTSCGSGSSAQSCAKEVDDLSADIGAVTKTTDLSTSTVTDSLKACGGPEEWRVSADVDKIGGQIGHLGDMNGQSLDSSAALDLLCARFDNSNSTDTCKSR